MACEYTIKSTGAVLSVVQMDDYLKSLPHEELAKFSPVVAALLGESGSGIRFSKVVSKITEENPLAIVHNLSLDNLVHAQKMVLV
jgi:hypothetical protein